MRVQPSDALKPRASIRRLTGAPAGTSQAAFCAWSGRACGDPLMSTARLRLLALCAPALCM